MSEMDAAAVQAAYSRWAAVYDWTFGRWFDRARRRAIELMHLEAAARVLEVGVGTGLSLPLFPCDSHVVGVDLSRPMLQKAIHRVHSGGGRPAALIEGDGTELPFADETFDAALVPFVVSAAPHPGRLLHDTLRVCRPGARIVVLNHFSPRSKLLTRAERGVSALTSRLLGFHADFPLEPFFGRAGVAIEHVERATTVGSWYIVVTTEFKSLGRKPPS